GRHGLVEPPPGAAGQGQAIALQGDGKIVVAGWDIRRYLSNGSPDKSFGTGGVASGPGAAFGSLVIDGSGRIVVAGTGVGGYTVARFLSGGQLDPVFGADGM